MGSKVKRKGLQVTLIAEGKRPDIAFCSLTASCFPYLNKILYPLRTVVTILTNIVCGPSSYTRPAVPLMYCIRLRNQGTVNQNLHSRLLTAPEASL